MTVASQRSYSGAGARQLILRLLFVVVALVPVGVLFVQVSRSTGDRITAGDQERRGVEYLTALGPLVVALAAVQTSAINFGGTQSEALTKAVAAVAAVDAKVGDSLGSHDRWHDLQSKITTLTNGPTSEPVGAYADFGGVTDLALALYTRVRQTSGLIRESATDTYYLQDGATRQLPEVVVAVGRLADQATLALDRAKADQVRTTAELLQAVGDANAPATDLVQDVQQAVDGTQGTILNTDFLSQLDRFRAAADALTTSTALVDGDVTKADVTGMAAMRTAITTAAAGLSASILSRIDGNLAQRGATDRQNRLIAEIAAGFAVLVGLIPLIGWAVARRRSRRTSRVELTDEDSGQIILPSVPAAARWERAGASR